MVDFFNRFFVDFCLSLSIFIYLRQFLSTLEFCELLWSIFFNLCWSLSIFGHFCLSWSIFVYLRQFLSTLEFCELLWSIFDHFCLSWSIFVDFCRFLSIFVYLGWFLSIVVNFCLPWTDFIHSSLLFLFLSIFVYLSKYLSIFVHLVYLGQCWSILNNYGQLFPILVDYQIGSMVDFVIVCFSLSILSILVDFGLSWSISVDLVRYWLFLVN